MNIAKSTSSQVSSNHELAGELKAAVADVELPYEVKIAKIANDFQARYNLIDSRLKSALDIIQWGAVTVENSAYPKMYRVISFKRKEEYLVNIDEHTCECADFQYCKAICKHRIAAGIVEEYNKQYPSVSGNRNTYTAADGKIVEW